MFLYSTSKTSNRFLNKQFLSLFLTDLRIMNNDSLLAKHRSEKNVASDRFIPLRESSINEYVMPSKFNLDGAKDLDFVDHVLPTRGSQLRFSRTKENNSRLAFQNTPDDDPFSHSRSLKIERQPVKVLEAPALLDDYYLSLVSWSKNNAIAVGLEDTVYLFNFLSNSVKKHFTIPRPFNSSGLLNSENDISSYVCSINFEDNGNSLAVGDSSGHIFITDIEKNKISSSSLAHTSRVGSLHWQENMLVSGSRDKTVRLFDVRQNMSHPVYSFAGHIQEICGLKLSPDNNYIASGGNDNQLLLWDIRRMKLLGSLGEHEAAVKALAWCPKQRSILISGAGTADRKLRIFDTAKCQQLAKIDTGSQVCNLIFDREGDSLISTHGYSLNQMIVWNCSKNFDRLKKEDVIIAHKLRVLYLAISPCGKYIATGAGDETIRIWNLVNQKKTYQNTIEGFGNKILTMR